MLPHAGYVYREIRDPQDGMDMPYVPGMTDITVSFDFCSRDGGIVISWFEPKTPRQVALYILCKCLDYVVFSLVFVFLCFVFWYAGCVSVWDFLIQYGVI